MIACSVSRHLSVIHSVPLFSGTLALIRHTYSNSLLKLFADWTHSRLRLQKFYKEVEDSKNQGMTNTNTEQK